MFKKVLPLLLGGSSLVSVLPSLGIAGMGTFATYRGLTAKSRLVNDYRKDFKELNDKHRKELKNIYDKKIIPLQRDIADLREMKGKKFLSIAQEFQGEYQLLYQAARECHEGLPQVEIDIHKGKKAKDVVKRQKKRCKDLEKELRGH